MDDEAVGMFGYQSRAGLLSLGTSTGSLASSTSNSRLSITLGDFHIILVISRLYLASQNCTLLYCCCPQVGCRLVRGAVCVMNH